MAAWSDGRIHNDPEDAPKEEIVTKLRHVEAQLEQGRPRAETIRSIEGTEVTDYRRRTEYGGLEDDQDKHLEELDAENQRLRRAISDLTLEKLILNDVDGK